MVSSRTLVLIAGLFACGGACGSKQSEPQPRTLVRADPPTTDRPRVVSSPSRARAVGTNLAAPTYWSSNYPFVDQLKVADGWISGRGETWDDGRTIATDEHGWIRRLEPGQIARLFLIGGDQEHPNGPMVVRYDGRGELQYKGSVRNLAQSEGRDTFVLDGRDGLYMEIHSVDPENPIRNIRAYLPGGRCENDAFAFCTDESACEGRCVPFEENADELPFHPEFLAESRPFGVLRFMDWQQTNRLRALPEDEEPPPVREWSELPTREDAFWRPVPVDVMIDLANLLDADPWFCIAHTASDDLVRQFAARAAERLEPQRRAYVEYTNEYWNDMFDQHQWINGQGCALYGTARECDPNRDGTLCEYTSWSRFQETCLRHGHRYFAERTVAIGALWNEALGERALRVMAGQIGGADWFVPDYLLHEVDGAPAHEGIDIVAVAPYFGAELHRAAALDDVFRRDEEGRYRMLVGEENAEYGGVVDWIAKDLRILRERLPEGAVQYVAYEGGQHLHNHEEAVMNLFLAANRDPRMESVYTQYLHAWRDLTDDALFVHYASPSVWNQYGAWGSKERQGQALAQAPKHRALLRFVAGQ
ncbi:MAG: hypothetical protein AAGE52_34780 [Myxococcota bacterium]